MKKRIKELFRSAIGIFSSSLTVFVVIFITTQAISLSLHLWMKFNPDVIDELGFYDIPPHFVEYVFTFISAILGYLFYLLAKYYMIKPLVEIYHAIEKISKGDYSVKLETKGLKIIKRVAKRINTMTRELQSIETMRNDLVNNFSHEFKTPLISVAGFAKLLKSEKITDEERKEYVDIIISESERMTKLSNSVLNLTRLDNVSVLTQIEKFNVSEQIRLVLVVLKDKWENKDITIDFDCDEYELEGNRTLIQQIWINILDNAIKFSPDKSLISIKVEGKSDKLVFKISDHGCGMSEEAQKHAFERFYQADPEHKASGNGIGLAIVKKICELHEGNVSIIASDSNGTTFEVILPKKQ